jgi:hypothetical protein
MITRIVGVVLIGLSITACQTAPSQPQLTLSKKTATELRSIQSRVFETEDRAKTVRAVIATLQDLGYSIDKVEPAAGTVTGTKLSQLRLTATVYPRGEKRMIVRSNAIVRMPNQNAVENQVDDPVFYQQLFFEPLSKAMFLSALQVNDADDPPPAGQVTQSASPRK